MRKRVVDVAPECNVILHRNMIEYSSSVDVASFNSFVGVGEMRSLIYNLEIVELFVWLIPSFLLLVWLLPGSNTRAKQCDCCLRSFKFSILLVENKLSFQGNELILPYLLKLVNNLEMFLLLVDLKFPIVQKQKI